MGCSLFSNEESPIFDFKGLQDALSDGQTGLEMRTNFLLVEIDGIFFVLARDMRNIDSDENVSGLLLKSDQDEKNPSEVVFGSLVAFDWMSGGEEDECWDVAKYLLVSSRFLSDFRWVRTKHTASWSGLQCLHSRIWSHLSPWRQYL